MLKIPQGKLIVPGVISHSTPLVEHPELLRVEVAGHTDKQGRADYNLTLSRDRAATVEAYLAAAVVYFVMCYSLSWMVKRLHQRIAIIR